MGILISWLLQEPADLDIHCLQEKPADQDLHCLQEKPADQDPYCLQELTGIFFAILGRGRRAFQIGKISAVNHYFGKFSNQQEQHFWSV